MITTRVREMVNRGNFKQALDYLSPFITDPMKKPIIISDYIVILFWDGRSQEAIEMFENLPPEFPKSAYLLRNIAKAYSDMNQFEKAISLYQAVLEQSPSDEEAHKGLVFNSMRLQNMQGRYVVSLKLYNILAEGSGIESDQIYKERDDLITSLTDEERQTLLKQLLTETEKNQEVMLDYILVLILNKDYKEAVSVFETAPLDIEQYSDYLLCWIAWAYFRTGDTEKAKQYYNRVLEKRPGYIRAQIGIAYCLSIEGKGKSALEILDNLLITEPNNLEIRFARAFAYEKLQMFWPAILEYDRILETAPDNPIARKLKLQDLSDLGISSLAFELASSEFPEDIDFQESLTGDMAVDRINWKESPVAKSILLPFLKDKKNMRARYDYLIALAENSDMEEVVEGYENLVKEGIDPPPWVLENAAKAYLYLEKPHEALELYDWALELDPASFDGRRGKFYTLQELRRWNEARKVLDDLDSGQPEVLIHGKLVRPNWNKLELAIDRGWLLNYEERYREAEDYFWELYERGPANTGVRSGLAHGYLWRGWPRKALREFKIIETLDPKFKNALIGKADSLNELAFKEHARELSTSLVTTYPKDKHVLDLARKLEVEEMSELLADFVFIHDEDGFEDIRAEITFTEPISLYTRLYGSLLWQQSSDDDQTEFYRRAGLGVHHIFNSSWRFSQKFSVNYDDGSDFGSFTHVNFTPDDYWSFSLSYDSFSTDVSLRARVFGIESDKLEASIIYRESEWRSYDLILSHMEFSDGNKRNEGLFRYEQGLMVKNDWKMRLLLDLYMSENTRDDAPYFNPDHDLSLSVTHMTQQTLWRIYRRAFIHKLYLTLGTYKQSGFSHHAIWSVRYQQEHDFSDTHALLWGITIGRPVYDGEPVHSYSLYLTYRGRF